MGEARIRGALIESCFSSELAENSHQCLWHIKNAQFPIVKLNNEVHW